MPLLALIAGYVIVLFVGSLGLLILWNVWNGRIDLRYLVSEKDGPASLSRFQFLIFTFVIAMCMLVLALESGEFPEIDGTLVALLGISGGSYVVSKGIHSAPSSKAPTDPEATTRGSRPESFRG
jgi:hypothetical protein